MRFRPPIAWIDACPRCPALPIALALGIGVAAGRLWLPVVPWAWIAVAVVALGAAMHQLRGERLASLLLLLSALFASTAATQLAAFRYPSNAFTHYIGDTQRLCRLRLYLPNEPRLRGATMFGERYQTPPRQATLATVCEVMTDAGWTKASGSVLLQLFEPVNTLHAGETIEVLGFAERPGLAMNPGQFDWQHYYRDLGVLNTVAVHHRANVTLLASDAAPFITQWREYVRGLFDQGFEETQQLDHALMAALLLGDYDPELKDVKEDFRKTGTSHHLAISGMHIAIVGGIVFLFCRLLGLGPRACWIAALVVVLLYGAAATPSPPVLRAVILFAAAGVAFIFARFIGAVQMLAMTVVLMLAIQPLDLFNAGFQLSFGTVLGLVLLSDPLAKRFDRDEVKLLPEEIERLTTGQRAIRWADRAGLRMMCAGVVAWLVSMPLIAANFQQLNPYQVVASILLGPLATACLVSGVVKIVGTALLPASAGSLAAFTATLSAWMREFVAWLATWPYGDVPLAAPPAWLVALCWIALAAAIIRWRLVTFRIAAVALVFITFGYMLIGPYLFGTPSTLKPGELRVTLMAVGAGQCALIEPAGGRVTMLDCGSSSVTDLIGNVIQPVLRARGETSVDTMFISHADLDHYSGASQVAAAYGTREIMVADDFTESVVRSWKGEQLIKDLNARQLPPRSVRPGDRIPLASDTSIEVLSPPPGPLGDNDNDRSLVLRLKKKDRTILFTGDIQTGGMASLLSSGSSLKSDVLIAPHHGSSEEITPKFVDAVSPSWILSSNDRTPTGKQKRFNAMMAGRRVLRTNEYGAITIVIEPDGAMRVEGFVKQP